jgi:hypothetical protein
MPKISHPRDSWPTYSTKQDLKREVIIDELSKDLSLDEKFFPLASSEFLHNPESFDKLVDAPIHNLPEDIIAFEIFLDLDEVVQIVIEHEKYTALYVLLFDWNGNAYIDNHFIQMMEWRREIK